MLYLAIYRVRVSFSKTSLSSKRAIKNLKAILKGLPFEAYLTYAAHVLSQDLRNNNGTIFLLAVLEYSDNGSTSGYRG